MINIQDSGRVSYKNARLRAWSFADKTKAIEFYNSDASDLGLILYTNELGYVVYGQDRLRANGYFVKEKAIIEVSIDNGTSWPISWTVDFGEDTLASGNLRNSAGTSVWKDNAGADYTLNYNDLKNRPALIAWKESEYVVHVNAWGQKIEVPASCTVLRLLDEDECLVNNCSYRKAVRLVFSRYGQQVIVVNETASDITLWDTTVPTGDQTFWDNTEQYTGAVCNLTAKDNVAAIGSIYLSDGTFSFVATIGKDRTDNEVQMTITVKTWGEVFTIPENVSLLKIYTDADCNNKNNACDYRTAIQLIFTRPGQLCMAVNMTNSDVQLWVAPNMSQPSDINGWAEATTVLREYGSATMIGVGTVDTSNVVRWWAVKPSEYVNGSADINETEQTINLGTLDSTKTYDIPLANTTRVLTLTGYTNQLADDAQTITFKLTGGKPGQVIMIGKFRDKSIPQGSTSSTDAHAFTQKFIASFTGWADPTVIITLLPSTCGQMVGVRINTYTDTDVQPDYLSV